MVEITDRSNRGFHQYGPEQTDTYGNRLDVYESSAASGPHVWLKIEPTVGLRDPIRAVAHMNESQARELIARLQAWVDEIPTRWKGKEEDA